MDCPYRWVICKKCVKPVYNKHLEQHNCIENDFYFNNEIKAYFKYLI